MASVSVLCLAKSFSALNIYSSPWSRCISRKMLFEKLQLPEKPRKPISCFFAFANDNRSRVIKENPNLSFTDIAKKLGQMWMELSEEEKQNYKNEYSKQYLKYRQAIVNFESSITNEQINEINQAVSEVTATKEKNILKKLRYDKIKEFNKPKAPLNVFARFMLDNYKGSKGNKPMPEFWKEMGEKWKNLSVSEKEKYFVEYEREKAEFLEKLDVWEKEMAEKGNFDVIRTKTMRSKLRKINL